MTTDELKKRLKVFALRIIKLSESLPNIITGNTIQLLFSHLRFSI
jgi:hypothetical protein